MKDLTNAHTKDYPKSGSLLTLCAGDSGWLLGVVSEVEVVLDPMEKVSVSGTQADGKYINNFQFDVPLSICLKGALAIMEYLTQHYGIKP